MYSACPRGVHALRRGPRGFPPLSVAAAFMVLLMAPLWPHAGPLTAAAARLGRTGAIEGLWTHNQQVRGLNSPMSDGQHRGQRLRQLKGAAALAPAPAPAEGA